MSKTISDAVNGNASPDATIDQLVANGEVQQFMSLVANHLKAQATAYQIGQSRANLGTAVGFQYDDKRDIFKAAGYKQTLIYPDFAGFHRRNSISRRIVEAPPNATWRQPPEVKDGKLGETEFTKAWESLVSFGQRPGTLNDQKTIWHYTHRSDVLAGIGRYGGLVVGINDGEELSEPLEESSNRPANDLLYLSPYDEANLVVEEVEASTRSRRFGLPKMYSLAISGDQSNSESRAESSETTAIHVHWSRVVHVAEGLLNDEIYGMPRLEACFNLLEDLLKVSAASGESAWQLMNKGIIASTKDGYKLPDNTDDITAAMESFMNELQKTLQLQGMDITVFGGEIVDPTGVIKSIIALVSATIGIPQRILLGAEAGQLASSMDEINWAKVIEARQVNFAEAVIMRPLISRFIFCGLLPQPESGGYQLEWGSQLSLNDLELADMASKEMSALASAVGEDKLPVESFLREILHWDNDQIGRLYEARIREIKLMIQDFPGVEQ